MPQKSQKKKVKQLTDGIKKIQICQITIPLDNKPPEVVLDDVLDPSLLAKWPKLKMKVPTIFLHKTEDFCPHVKKVVALGINFYFDAGSNYTRIFCHSFNDHKLLVQYFDKLRLPYHTFGHPSKRKLKVVIRGLGKDTDLDKLKQALKAANIPIVRVHKMHVKEFAKDRGDILVLAVVPYDDEGKKLLRVKQIFGKDVTLEPPKAKTRQCHRCQKWGHSQRYCHGTVKCVKCAGDHFSNKCTRDPEVGSPTCANCGGDHTANYRECFYCPNSLEYKKNQKNKMNKQHAYREHLRTLVTMENCESLMKPKNVTGETLTKARNVFKNASKTNQAYEC